MQIEPRVGEATPDPIHIPQPRYRWYHKFSALLFVVFCMEIGLFLVVFPWTDAWDANFFAAVVPGWHRWWTNAYVRGAVSGMGVLNLYISLVEVFRLRRFSNRGAGEPR